MITIGILRELLAEAEQEFADARSDLAAAQLRAATAEQEYLMFATALARREGSSSTVTSGGEHGDGLDTDPAVQGSEIARLPRTHAVKHALERLTATGDPVGPKDIQSYLVRNGRDDSRDRVSAALAHLSRKNEVHRTGQAQWLPGPSIKSADSVREPSSAMPTLTSTD